MRTFGFSLQVMQRHGRCDKANTYIVIFTYSPMLSPIHIHIENIKSLIFVCVFQSVHILLKLRITLLLLVTPCSLEKNLLLFWKNLLSPMMMRTGPCPGKLLWTCLSWGKALLSTATPTGKLVEVAHVPMHYTFGPSGFFNTLTGNIFLRKRRYACVLLLNTFSKEDTTQHKIK